MKHTLLVKEFATGLYVFTILGSALLLWNPSWNIYHIGEVIYLAASAFIFLDIFISVMVIAFFLDLKKMLLKAADTGQTDTQTVLLLFKALSVNSKIEKQIGLMLFPFLLWIVFPNILPYWVGAIYVTLHLIIMMAISSFRKVAMTFEIEDQK